MAKKTVENFVARAPPGLGCTYDVGSGGFRLGCLKVVRHLKNGKFTKLADAVEGTRNISPAEVDDQVLTTRSA